MFNCFNSFVEDFQHLVKTFVEIKAFVISEWQENSISSKQFQVEVQIQLIVVWSWFSFQLKKNSLKEGTIKFKFIIKFRF